MEHKNLSIFKYFIITRLCQYGVFRYLFNIKIKSKSIDMESYWEWINEWIFSEYAIVLGAEAAFLFWKCYLNYGIINWIYNDYEILC